MGSPYVGEIRLVAFNFTPVGWSFCNGATLAISQNEVLFNLIGTTYGGDGVNTFNLPDLQGRIPVHQGSGFVLGQKAGAEAVTLLASQMPAHTHLASALDGAGSQQSLQNAYWAGDSASKLFATAPTSNSTLAPTAIGNAGSNQPHENRMPYLTINFIISLFGIFPSQN
jgi:microcystin-dependent protein